MSISTRHVSIFKWLKLVLFTKYVFYKSALPSDTLSVGRKLLWKYRNIVPRLVICLLPDGRICKLVWSSPEVQQFSQPTIISNCSRDCRQPQNLGGSKIFGGTKVYDFMRICLEKRLSKHKMTIFSKNLGFKRIAEYIVASTKHLRISQTSRNYWLATCRHFRGTGVAEQLHCSLHVKELKVTTTELEGRAGD